ncbi:SAM-dependent methyltransferase [Bordetella sp. H567]|uniref:class I SAM-dependent methyltransferase n=1 Tax=Bordetella sp. H567 TaxID=1697043 RepID=UPI00081C659A|nr:methyltransferase domain-containing protein [Bordetella sp. H567]AOB29718.1 SAM-dependent methyltransferase [Bordetella sp. H567]
MAQSDKVFAGSVPETYDAYLVPLIFEQYAADLANRVMAHAPRAILETAAGSGAVARALAPLLPPDARYVVTDLNQPMLDRAIARQGTDERIVWQQADALSLPFPDASFDVVCCQFGAMFFPDRVAAYREALRVLKPGGTFLFSVWDRIEDNDFARVVTDTLATLFPLDPPRFLARTPHGYHRKAQIEADVQAAGFSDVRIETISRVSATPSPRVAAVAFCQGTPLRDEIAARDTAALEKATIQAAEAIARTCGNGAVSGKTQAHVVTARP